MISLVNWSEAFQLENDAHPFEQHGRNILPALPVKIEVENQSFTNPLTFLHCPAKSSHFWLNHTLWGGRGLS